MSPAGPSSLVAATTIALAHLLAPCDAFAQQGVRDSGGGAESDSSPHGSAAVTVSGVRIHYLDWGGTGPALVFVPGFGNSAHIFDEFAPRFTDQFRVVAITRIGFGESDKPESDGYDLASRVAHIGAVLDSLGLTRAVLVGHSFGGEEITAFASAHPERTVGLVYLDAAYDHLQALEWQRSLGPFLSGAPRPGPADRANARAYQDYFERVRGVRYPIGEVLANNRFDSAKAVLGSRAPEEIMQVFLQVTTPLEYSGIRAPALALYSDLESAADMMPWLRADSAANASATATLRESVGPAQHAERERFAREVSGGEVKAFRAHHYQFLSHPVETERLMREFLVALPRDPNPR